MSSPQLILLAHGSRDPRWCQIFEKGLSLINEELEQQALLAYMEMAQPDLEAVLHREYQRGTRHFAILPLFFAEGRHLLHDVPEQLTALRSSLPDAEISLQEAVGREDSFWSFLGRMIATRPPLRPGAGH